MAGLSDKERTELNYLAVHGLHALAVCVEYLLRHGETIIEAKVAGNAKHIVIMPPRASSQLLSDADTAIQSERGVTMFTVRHGCTILWQVTHAEATLARAQQSASRAVH